MAIFRTLLRRAFSSPLLYVSILLVPVMLWIPMANTSLLRHPASEIIDIALTGNGCIYLYALCILPAIPFVMSYVDDSDTNMLSYWAIRAGSRSYAVAYVGVVMLTGFLTVFVGISLFLAVLVCCGHPLGGNNSPPYGALYAAGHTYLYNLCLLLTWSTGGMSMAAIAAAAAACFRHKVGAVVTPISVQALLYLFMDYTNPFDVHSLLFGNRVSLGTSPLVQLAGQFFFSLVYCGIAGCIAVWSIKRRVKHG